MQINVSSFHYSFVAVVLLGTPTQFIFQRNEKNGVYANNRPTTVKRQRFYDKNKLLKVNTGSDRLSDGIVLKQKLIKYRFSLTLFKLKVNFLSLL